MSPSARELESLEAEAERLEAEAAPASAFEALRKRGWRERSYTQGAGLQPCGGGCGVCYPTPAMRRRRPR